MTKMRISGKTDTKNPAAPPVDAAPVAAKAGDANMGIVPDVKRPVTGSSGRGRDYHGDGPVRKQGRWRRARDAAQRGCRIIRVEVPCARIAPSADRSLASAVAI